MDINKRRGSASIAYWRICWSWIVLSSRIHKLNQPREIRMSDLGL
jgi:hypothetical protein